jgi:hypothetical protein
MTNDKTPKSPHQDPVGKPTAGACVQVREVQRFDKRVQLEARYQSGLGIAYVQWLPESEFKARQSQLVGTFNL